MPILKRAVKCRVKNIESRNFKDINEEQNIEINVAIMELIRYKGICLCGCGMEIK